MHILDYTFKNGGVSTLVTEDYLLDFHPTQLDFSSYGLNQVDLVAFKVDFAYVSQKGKSSIRTSSRLFMVAYDKLPSREYGERTERCQKYFKDWVAAEGSKFKKATVLSLRDLGEFSFRLDSDTPADSLRAFVLNQNKNHVHYEELINSHVQNCIIDLSVNLNIYEFSYKYETVRSNIREAKKLVFTSGVFDSMYLQHVLNVSISSECLDKNRQLSNVEILEGNLIGQFLLSA